jgi:FHA domain
MPADSRLKLIQLDAGRDVKTIDLDTLPVVLGRQPPRGVAIPHPTISREHARIFESGGKFSVADLNSSNGTFVNGARVTRADLRQGDRLRLGEVELRVDLGEPSANAPEGHVDAGADRRDEAVRADADVDGGIQLEEGHLGIDVHGGSAPIERSGTATFIAPPSAGGVGGGIAPPPKSVYAEALRRPRNTARSGNLLTADVAQQSTFRRFATILLALAIAGGLFYGAMTMMENVTPAGGFGADEGEDPAPPDESR